tara:strand:- start:215 stop:901 length:687 start_codon:yes stop_codon:yes gene_type:complete
MSKLFDLPIILEIATFLGRQSTRFLKSISELQSILLPTIKTIQLYNYIDHIIIDQTRVCTTQYPSNIKWCSDCFNSNKHKLQHIAYANVHIIKNMNKDWIPQTQIKHNDKKQRFRQLYFIINQDGLITRIPNLVGELHDPYFGNPNKPTELLLIVTEFLTSAKEHGCSNPNRIGHVYYGCQTIIEKYEINFNRNLSSDIINKLDIIMQNLLNSEPIQFTQISDFTRFL